MAQFKYKAVAEDGQVTSGLYDCADESQVIDMLRQRSMRPISINHLSELNRSFALTSNGPNAKTLAIFCRQLHSMLSTGIHVVACFNILRRESTSKQLREASGEIYEELQKGFSLSETLKKRGKVFPPLMVSLIEVGEASGSLDIVVKRLAENYEKQSRINSKVTGAMIYPVVLFIVAVCVVIFMLVSVLPQFMVMYGDRGEQLPALTRSVMAVSNFVTENYLFLAAAVVAVVLIFRRFKRSYKGKLFIDGLFLDAPVLGAVNKRLLASRFTRTMSILLASGSSLVDSLELTARAVMNKKAEEAVIRAKEYVKRGIGLSVAIRETNLFPPMMNSMITIGEETGKLDEVLAKSADVYEEETEAAITKFLALVEPAMILLMAGIIGVIAVAMMLPIVSMYEIIN